MTPLHAIVLAVVQGVTEFLPISSSAHLVLVPVILGWPDQGLAFDMATHVGSLLAVIWYFRRDVRELVLALPAALRPGPTAAGSEAELVRALGVGTIPVAVAGLLAQDLVATAGRDVAVIAWASIGFGLLLAAADFWGTQRRTVLEIGLGAAFVVGLFQALALIPGTSRSGITMTAALLLGFSRPVAARFSMLLSIPVMLLVGAKDVLDIARGAVEHVAWIPLLVGFGGAAITAYVAIAALLAWVERQNLQVFVVYRVLLGLGLLWLVA